MFDSVKNVFGKPEPPRAVPPGWPSPHSSRPARSLPGRLRGSAATAGKLCLGTDLYQSIGVRPLINCRGTLTVISGSLELPEVRAAVDAGGLHHVALDELMDAAAAAWRN